MRKILLSLLLVGLMALPVFAQCGPWGCPVQRQPASRVKIKQKIKVRGPTPAWRYERAVGYRTAVVRIQGRDTVRVSSLGSGVLVRWGKRVVVLTARHVVKDAKTVIVRFHNGKRYRARVIKVNVRWDCAVLDIGGVAPDGIEPAEFAFGADAAFKNGDRLESCGYGADNKLAVNIGLFKGYRRSSAAMDGPDDWMVISGHARGGDSGGPVFDQKGRVVGILWGTDGRTVVCVQPGRIHVMLDGVIAEQLAIFDRKPTPPAYGPLEPVDQSKLAGGDRTLLPWRKESAARDKALAAQMDQVLDINAKILAGQKGTDVDVSIGRQPVTPPVQKPALLWMWGLGGLAFAGFIYYAGMKG